MSATEKILDEVSASLAAESMRLLSESSHIRQVNFLLHKVRRITPEIELLIGVKAVADILYMIDRVSEGYQVTLTEEHRKYLDIDLSAWLSIQHQQPERFVDNLKELLSNCLHAWLTALEPYRQTLEELASLLCVAKHALDWKDVEYGRKSASPKDAAAPVENALSHAVDIGAVPCQKS